MKTNIRLTMMLSVLAVVLSVVTAASAQIILGGYKQIPTTAPDAVNAADFAAKAQSEKDAKEYQRGEIAKAERQSVMGANYRLCMQVIADEDEPYFVQAVVYLDLKGNYKLTSWALSDCGGAAGDATKGSAVSMAHAPDNYKPTDKDNAGVGLAADFAVKEQSTRSKTTITLGSIVKAEDGDAKMGARNLRLCLSVTAAGKPLVAQAVVHVDQYSNHKLMFWTKSTCGKSAGGNGSAGSGFVPTKEYKVIDNEGTGLNLAADFAVKEQASRTKAKITPATIVKAESFEPKLGASNMRLCLKTTVNGKATTAQTIITVDQYSNYKLVSWTEMKCGEAAAADFKPISNGDAGAGLAADFAVKEQAKRTKSKITPATIVKAEDQEPKLFYRNFRLCLTMTVNGKPSTAQAVISVDQYSNHKLVSWTESKCGPSEDDFVQVATTHAGIGLAADFAVKEHSKTTKFKHSLASILKGEEKGKFAMTYRVCMKITEGNDTHVIQAVVTMDQYSNMKLVSWEHSNCGGN